MGIFGILMVAHDMQDIEMARKQQTASYEDAHCSIIIFHKKTITLTFTKLESFEPYLTQDPTMSTLKIFLDYDNT